ncbi:glycosyltransferase family 2 protein [Thiomicrorhabdus sediminis]|uniref:Glycosyltransferase family 2 protein n=1 Tax=Thiomicrorhabdus sediminis TaxID=2580412 RepID=A0A4P9K5L0_9GAMM|nr:glycosyltransferase family 2 protein [Thiomicrorhabdus sediminis]QCU89546.1 glycosyltransferase family 2 protein [Thiomicrorhabdus sediminis]
MKNYDVDVVVLNYRNYEDTIDCISSLLKSSCLRFRVIVIDNNSGNESIEKINSFLLDFGEYAGVASLKEFKRDSGLEARFFLVKSDENLGYGGGNNLGIELSLHLNSSRYIWVLNNDTVVDYLAMESLIKKMDKVNSLICGSTIYYQHSKSIQCYSGAIFNDYLMTSKYINLAGLSEGEVEKKQSYICGASMFFRKEYFLRYGMFDTRYFLYFEEMDLAKRLPKYSYLLAYSEDSIVYHKEGAVAGSSNNTCYKTELSEYHSFRSRIKFTKKHFPLRLPIIYCLSSVYILHRLVIGKFSNAKVIFKATLFS